MYLIRRVWEVEPRNARLAATIAAEIGKRYSDAGQRDSVVVYFNGSTLPGERGRVYMEWQAEVIDSPYRSDNVYPPDPRELYKHMTEVVGESWIEFYELLTDDTAMELDF
jgi:hypothetical protein